MDGKRCDWVGTAPIYLDYHDTEWGVPEWDARALWEKLILDGFQAGLSWITILKKRDAFREAFAGFDPEVIASWGEADVTRLLANPGIVRHRGKMEATIGNARAYCELNEGFDSFLWRYVDGVPLQNRYVSQADVPPSTPLSTRVSRDLKKAGFRFCGPTIVYAFMEACGLVNDHLVDCPRHGACAALASRQNPDASC
ncbi:DNA-3-methyladenine glycosylase I [Marinovum sp. 2_MG-2023]|uniref:DNA-3-methyladenine glycosylase I n=1 Tax=unclassified Marinovum TaxID=2647166 RepID=UPI0026E18302|nr:MULTISPECIES: DNA-3-methyladenine glycosylase I [unclassified Marinovum]MDO6728438.1 DNA-3-methyladenine glycosylase I [Marinovum sp. 2_MG-2023]MDO6778146.1 DNA-3-methyladenine glycosylase I [Marinovum sp. 1_MG-2023]